MALAVLSGCANAGGGSEVQVDPSTSQVIVETQADPWALPLEERPELFDPCAEIPLEAVEAAVGGPVETSDLLTKREFGSLLACGWNSDEVMLDILSTWKPHGDFVSDPAEFVESDRWAVAGREALRLTDGANDPAVCRDLFFTEQGTVVISLSLPTTFESFKGERFVEVCDALDEVSSYLADYVPEGDFR